MGHGFVTRCYLFATAARVRLILLLYSVVNAEALVVATKEIGLEVNADKTKYMVMSRDRNAGRGHSVKIDNSSI